MVGTVCPGSVHGGREGTSQVSSCSCFPHRGPLDNSALRTPSRKVLSAKQNAFTCPELFRFWFCVPLKTYKIFVTH